MSGMQTNSFTNVNLPTNGAETVVATTPGYVYDFPTAQLGVNQGGQGVVITGMVDFTVVGAGVTAAQIRVRQGGLSGAQVGPTIAAPVAAGVPNNLNFTVDDPSRFAAQAGGGVYVLTVSETGATGASTVSGSLNLEGA